MRKNHYEQNIIIVHLKNKKEKEKGI